MYEYEEKSDIIGSPCSLMNPYKGYTEGTIVGDYGNTVVVRLTSGKEIVEFRDEVIIYRFFGRAETVFCQAVRAHNGVLRHRQDSLAFDAVRTN